MGYNLPINGIYWGYNPLTNLLLTSWDIQVEDDPADHFGDNFLAYFQIPNLLVLLLRFTQFVSSKTAILGWVF